MSTTTTTRPSEGYRSVDGQVYDVDQRRHQVVVSIPHERLDTFKTDFAKGAFADSFRRKPHVPMLAEHRPENLIGHTLKAEVRAADNLLVGQFSDLSANPVANRYFNHIVDGDIRGWSFRFARGEYTVHPSVRTAIRYTRADFEELSAVAFPAVPGTATLDVRSAGGTHGADLLADLDRIDQVRRRGELISLGAAMDRYHERDIEQLRQSGQLPRGIRTRCYDAYTAVSAREADLLEEIEDAFARADRHGR
jgi:HK97 family phage prohead protease